MSLFARIGKLFNDVVNWFRAESGSPPPSPPLILKVHAPPPPRPAPERTEPPPRVDSTPEPPPAEPDPQEWLPHANLLDGNRATRRKLERARRRHDKFVKPEGPLPVPPPPREAAPKPKLAALPEAPPEPDQFDDPNDMIVADEWLEGSGDKVLFETSEFYGEYNFRDTILDQLERYWVYLARMRKHDKDAYEFYKVMGATLLPYMATRTRSETPKTFRKFTPEELEDYKAGIYLPTWFKQHWPAFGCIAYGINPVDEASELAKDDHGHEHYTPKFLYFRRLKNVPWTVQPVIGGHVYVLTVWWDRPQDKHNWRWGRPCEYPFHISRDGRTIRALKTRKHPDGNIGPWWDWQYADDTWCKQYGLDVQTHLTHLFCTAVEEIEESNYAPIRVEVVKDDLTAVFGIGLNRTSYFFQDRDFILTANGRRRRVFHFVRPHVRKDGAAVRAHFRGLREFTWAGYQVRVTVPGRDHFMPIEFNVPAMWDVANLKGTISEGQVAIHLHDQMMRGLK